MRLLNTRSVTLENFTSEIEVPRYAILSHTWGLEEVTFSDIQSGSPKHLHGYLKLKKACQQCCQDGIKYLWADTCCIDKQSSSELSEAINSMFKWYAAATVCYVYLEDVEYSDIEEYRDLPLELNMTSEQEHQIQQSSFAKSRWWTRGWTLQELIAPYDLTFFDQTFTHIGSKTEFVRVVSLISGIDEGVLQHNVDLREICVATKMSWAARRKTTRTEDVAYSLLGIFGINMAMIYGEGNKAFLRLQHEIIQSTNDQTIFAWSGYMYQNSYLFAPGPSCFKSKDRIISLERWKNATEFSLTNAGLDIQLPIWKSNEDPMKNRLGRSCRRRRWIVPLACRYETDFSGRLALEVEEAEERGTYILCPSRERLFVFDTSVLGALPRTKSLMIRHQPSVHAGTTLAQRYGGARFLFNKKCLIQWRGYQEFLEDHDCYPPESWNKRRDVFWLKRGHKVMGVLHLLMLPDQLRLFLTVGYERLEHPSGVRWGKEWVVLEAVNVGTSLHDYYEGHQDAKSFSLEKLSTRSTYDKFGLYTIEATVQERHVQEEEVYLVDISVTQSSGN